MSGGYNDIILTPVVVKVVTAMRVSPTLMTSVPVTKSVLREGLQFYNFCFALTSSLSVNAWRRAVSATLTPSTQMSSVAPQSNVSTASAYQKVRL